jgi:lipoprotein-releasing system ATP-binding protein
MSSSAQTTGAKGGGKTLLQLKGVSRRYEQGGAVIDVLRNADLDVRGGELTALVGPSGSGKSTLLNVAGLLERPTEGEVIIDGAATGRLGTHRRGRLRGSHIGFVFQFHRLLPEFSALENVMIPQMIGGLSRVDAETRAEQLLAMVGLRDRASHRPGTLSGGEQQRVAIARAVANAPRVLLADEPTGNLDPETAADVFQHLRQIVHGTGSAALIVTHNEALAATMDRRLTIRDGGVVEL